MTPTPQQSLPVEALPIRQDLHWEIQKYLRHPTAELLAGSWESVFKNMLEKQRVFVCSTPKEMHTWRKAPYRCISVANRTGDVMHEEWQKHQASKCESECPPHLHPGLYQALSGIVA